MEPQPVRKAGRVALGVLCVLLFGALLLPAPVSAAASADESVARARGKVHDALWRRAARGAIARVLVQYRSVEVDVAADARLARRDRGARNDSRRMRRDGYRALKRRARSGLRSGDVPLVRDYRHIPMSAVRVRNRAELLRLLRRPEVEAVYEDRLLYPTLAQSLPLVHQGAAAALGLAGDGTTVAVIDTGVDYTRQAFGSCTAPGVPAATCKVIHAEDFATEDNARDANGHGSSVAGIVVGTAPGTRIAALDVFDGGTAASSDVIAAIDWAIGNRDTWNIVALNLSLGDGVNHTTPCERRFNNPYRSAIANAASAGILSVVSAGNEGYTNGIAAPACTPEAVSVGAVYDSSFGAAAWSACSDASTAADQVTCFSNTASFLTLFAPGARITAAGVTYGGTSQAAPHVSGAIAILRAVFPTDSVAATVSRLTASGVPVTDNRATPALTKPRLDFQALLAPPGNDAFEAPANIAGSSGTQSADTRFASKQSGEPDHAGNAGGASLWWQWTAPTAASLSLTTDGSGIDTLLAVYTGDSVNALAAVAANDDAGGPQAALTLLATAGTTYAIAVDGKDGARGAMTLAWSLDSDRDGLSDELETATGTDPLDLDSDDDGLADGDEDVDRNGLVDAGETDPRRADSDDDGLQDGTESGLIAGLMDPDGAGPLLGTDAGVFSPDADPSTVTSPINADSDGDGSGDGEEDSNRNGALDPDETDPNDPASLPFPARQVPMPDGWLAVLALALLLAARLARVAGRP